VTSLDADLTAKITKLVAKANGGRRTFLMTLDDVLGAIDDAVADPNGVAVRHGGSDPFAQNHTTLCLAVRPPNTTHVVVGIGHCRADRPTPGRIWKPISPWYQDFAKNVDRARQWAARTAPDRVVVPIRSGEPASKRRPARSTPTSGDRLLAAVLADPGDDAARLVYADFLTQSGDPRGELITVQCALATARRRDRTALSRRAKALLRAHRRTWTRAASQVALECELRRGFVAAIKATASTFATRGAVLFERDPVEELVISKPSGAGLRQLADAPHLARLRAIHFSSPLALTSDAVVDDLRAFLRSKHLAKVPALGIQLVTSTYGGPLDGVETLFEGLPWSGVRSLAISFVGGPRTLDALVRLKLPALETLVVRPRSGPQLAELRAAFPDANVSTKFSVPRLVSR
jgi:uncharacterized protein (TIGR02996 family)